MAYTVKELITALLDLDCSTGRDVTIDTEIAQDIEILSVEEYSRGVTIHAKLVTDDLDLDDLELQHKEGD